MATLSSLYADMQKREAGALAANKAREAEIRGIYGEIIGQGQGAARTAGLAEIEKGKTQAVGAGTQQMISSGLYGTTTAASLPVQAENQASLSRLKLEDMLTQRTTQAKLGLAGFAERIETPYPDYNMLMQAMIAQASQPQGTPAVSGRLSGRLSQLGGGYGRGTIMSGGSGYAPGSGPGQAQGISPTDIGAIREKAKAGRVGY